MNATYGKMTGAEIVTTTLIAEAIEKLGRIDAGFIYEAVSASGRMTRDEFEAIIDRLVRFGEVRRDGRMLVWIG